MEGISPTQKGPRCRRAILRNQQIHATTTAVYNPAIAARIIAAPRALIAELFGDRLIARPAASAPAADPA